MTAASSLLGGSGRHPRRHSGLPRSARGSTRPPQPRSSPPRVHPARPAGGSAPAPPAHRSCSATGLSGPAPQAAAGSGSAPWYSVRSVVRSSLCFSTFSSSVTRPSGVEGGGAGPARRPSPPSYSAMKARTRSAVLSDSERPPSIWRTRFGSPSALIPNVVGLRPVRRRNAPQPRSELLLQRPHGRNGEDPFARTSTRRKCLKCWLCVEILRRTNGPSGGSAGAAAHTPGALAGGPVEGMEFGRRAAGAPRCRQAGSSRIGARQGCYGLPDAHEPQRARRGPIPSAVVSA